MRAPYQILAIPYKFIGQEVYFCIFHRSDSDIWQFVAGGGEEGEKLLECAKREVKEETGAKSDGIFMLRSIAYVPVAIVSREKRTHWDKNTYVIPECSFAFECKESIILSDEHDDYMWVSYDEAMGKLRYDSNKSALYELMCILNQRSRFSFAIGNIISSTKATDYAITITKITDTINSVLTQKYNIKIKTKTISDWLLEKGLIESYVTRYGNKRKRITENGVKMGIFSKIKFIRDREFGYHMFLFKKEAQQFIIDNLDQILSSNTDLINAIYYPNGVVEAKIPEMDELRVPTKNH